MWELVLILPSNLWVNCLLKKYVRNCLCTQTKMINSQTNDWIMGIKCCCTMFKQIVMPVINKSLISVCFLCLERRIRSRTGIICSPTTVGSHVIFIGTINHQQSSHYFVSYVLVVRLSPFNHVCALHSMIR